MNDKQSDDSQNQHSEHILRHIGDNESAEGHDSSDNHEETPLEEGTKIPEAEATGEPKPTTDTDEEKPPVVPESLPVHVVLTPIDAESEPKHKSQFNKYFLYTLVAGLIISALISVAAVLVGSFNSTMTNALSTTASMVIHTFIILFLVSLSSKSHGKTAAAIYSTLIFVAVASFITSVLDIWSVISGQITYDLYVTYCYTVMATLWIQLLLRVGEIEADKATRVVTRIAIGFTALFYVLLLPVTFTNYPHTLPEFYTRVVAAGAILLATASILTTVFRRIYLHQHPDSQYSNSNAPWDIIAAIIVFFVGLPIIVILIAQFTIPQNVATPYMPQSSTAPYGGGGPILPSKTPAPGPQATNTSAADCTKVAPYTSLAQTYAQGTVASVDTAEHVMTLNWSGTSYYVRWNIRTTMPTVVDSTCATISPSRLIPGVSATTYGPAGDVSSYQNTQLIQIVSQQ